MIKINSNEIGVGLVLICNATSFFILLVLEGIVKGMKDYNQLFLKFG